jgi:hypothetical protein
MFCLRLAWLVVAYPMQVNKFDFGRVSFQGYFLLFHVYQWKMCQLYTDPY